MEISVEAQKHFGMQVEAAQVHELNEFLQVPGTVQPIDSRVNTVRPLARGRLHDVLVRVGDRVAKGQPLATYDNIEAGELVAQLAGARADLERLRGQERNLTRQTDRSAPWPISALCRRRSSSRPARISNGSAEHQVAGKRHCGHSRAAATIRHFANRHSVDTRHDHYVAVCRRGDQAGGVAG